MARALPALPAAEQRPEDAAHDVLAELELTTSPPVRMAESTVRRRAFAAITGRGFEFSRRWSICGAGSTS